MGEVSVMARERRVYKYEANPGGGYTVPFKDANVVLVAQQDGSLYPVLWVEVDVQEGSGGGTTSFACAGTGFMLIPGDEHVGSAVCGSLVWHVYRNRYQPLR